MVGWCVFIIIVKLLYCVYERERERERRERAGARGSRQSMRCPDRRRQSAERGTTEIHMHRHAIPIDHDGQGGRAKDSALRKLFDAFLRI